MVLVYSLEKHTDLRENKLESQPAFPCPSSNRPQDHSLIKPSLAREGSGEEVGNLKDGRKSDSALVWLPLLNSRKKGQRKESLPSSPEQTLKICPAETLLPSLC